MLKEKSNIVLIGFMGTGKTVVGKVIAKEFSYSFVDTDKEIEKREKMSIDEIFQTYGERYFRKLESEIIKKISSLSSQVIATGGGAIKIKENMNNLKKNSIIICLKATPETILKRLEKDKRRPLLKVEDRIGRIKELIKKREKFYKVANFFVDTTDKRVNEIAKEILEILNHDKVKC